ncbi:hypothetical protein [Alicyclobacillus fodiniaquatilis]|uniref:hypothetical protein n=1 Tax=Alicyclobacillus fodiniaquatilis TaxID=1661150 RepID=UPI00366F597A
MNIGEIPDGPVKHILDCLHPILGGKEGSPNDMGIEQVTVMKGTDDLANDEIGITIWGGKNLIS